MKKLSLLSYPIYEFSCDENLVNDVKKHVESLKFFAHDTFQLYDNYYHKELFHFFNESIAEVKNLYYKKSLDFPIVSCWANKYTMTQNMSNHTHSNGIISGLFYVTTHENIAPTVFNTNDPWTNFYDSPYQIFKLYDEQKVITSTIYPKAGTLLLFPSHMKHYVMTMNKIEVRYTISFNCFPKGLVSDETTSRLLLDVKSVEDTIKLDNK